MKTPMNQTPTMDDIVFEERNKEYGAYKLRKSYLGTLSKSSLAVILTCALALGIPFVLAIYSKNVGKLSAVIFESGLESFDEEENPITPPPPPPPPPPTSIINSMMNMRVVDSVVNVDLGTIDNALDNSNNASLDTTRIVSLVPVKSDPVLDDKEDKIVIFCTEPTEFNGGVPALMAFLQKELHYPAACREGNIQGKVFVKFVVTKTGKVSQVQIVRGVDPLLDAEAIRVVKLLPDWKPGKQQGIPVSVWFTLPIVFSLQ